MEIEKELTNLINENNLSPFSFSKTSITNKSQSPYKTRDSKSIHTKVLNKIASNFIFPETSNFLTTFSFTENPEEIIKRQEFFKQIPKNLTNQFLKALRKPRPTWKPNYGIVATTDNEETFNKLKGINIPVKYLLNEDDVLELENYDIVQAVDIEQFTLALEQLPQSVLIDSVDNVYLERYLQILSGWKDNFEILKQIPEQSIINIIQNFNDLFNLISLEKSEKITREIVETKLEIINQEISDEVKEKNISGTELLQMLSDNKIPEALQEIINRAIKKSNLPVQFLDEKIPVKINENELEEFLKLQDANENTDFSKQLKRNSETLKKVPELLDEIETKLLLYDFYAGISKFIKEQMQYPSPSEEFLIENALNLFLEIPQPVSFNLNENQRCSILTGANSGGKTTLIEHILQINSLFNLGLPIYGIAKLPMFTEIYYFAKNKGSASKGAFETLLTQMSKINPGQKTLILADEIEAVTEPGVAGKIIAASADYFIKQNCFLIIATHLGHEIKDILPEKSRIDGIFAKGLNQNDELIVDHNPRLGEIANSTPELIVEKMARTENKEYFHKLNEFLKNNHFPNQNNLHN
jgi:DNA mismatch repair protein MutS2